MIDVTHEDDFWIVTLNRPEKANALTADMLKALITIVIDLRDTAKAVVFTGMGSVFSAGADLDEAPKGLAVSQDWDRLSSAIAALPCLTICALNGTLAGGAFGMALACDLRLSVPTAKFFYPVMRLGFLPQPADPIRMSQLIGPARTKMILMAGEKVLADEALAWGLVDRIVAPDELLLTARRLCEPALTAEASHIQGIKELISQ
ncbi:MULTISPECIES: enoyl-CoA hydratase/isomerase family protein [Pacificibacter]|uniref:enoyl-CoA hydratase/isomerase family protein n=1 Tax=Pacificibacter TaxID=1042323 RepID=UPI001C098CC0|nr:MULTISPECIES: enoyl-CoA hydratase/isomerase family protein [Pacificibacter]MBU2936023.1 enoyl-CoA hydratase/isomerase family protein [Pacificibacter marinus]MDO6615128.1 enoyl-CoA hydratase/isomerase family protein [Pacificibacter sp. 1_MG-2023]